MPVWTWVVIVLFTALACLYFGYKIKQIKLEAAVCAFDEMMFDIKQIHRMAVDDHGWKHCTTCEEGWPGTGWPCPTTKAMRRNRRATEEYFLG